MKTLTFSDKSWHYHFAKTAGFDCWSDQTICTYMNRVFWGMFIHVLVGTVAAIFAKAAIDLILGIAFSLFFGSFMMSDAGFALMCLIGIISAYAFMWNIQVVIGAVYRWVGNTKNVKKPDGFVVNAYKSWKEKFCLPITITRD